MISLRKRLIYLFFQRFGFFIPKRIFNPKIVYNQLKCQSNDVIAFELKRISLFMSRTRNHKYYDELLHIFVPSWNLYLNNKKFIGNGIGLNSFDSFRKVCLDDKWLFEKVYFNLADDLNRNKFFQDNIRKFISYVINSPELLFSFKGNCITIAYFEFNDLYPIDPLKSIDYQINFATCLLEQSIKFKHIISDKNIPDFIFNFETHFEFKKNIDLVESFFNINNINLKFFKNKLDKSTKIFTHGDIQRTNIFKGDILIDWDAFGIYPIGFDLAFIYFRQVMESSTHELPGNWLDNNLNGKIWLDYFNEVKFNYNFILFVFFQNYFNEGRFLNIKDALFSEINNVKFI